MRKKNKFFKINVIYVLLLCIFTTGLDSFTRDIVYAAETISLVTMPEYPEDGQTYWVIFKEGYRNSRVEMSTCNVLKGSGTPWILWNRNMTLQGASMEGRVNQYYLSDEYTWIEMNPYGIFTDWATEVIASNLDIYDANGNIVLRANDYYMMTDTLSQDSDIGINVEGDGVKTFYAMVLNGVNGDRNLGTDNDAALMYDRFIKNEASGYIIKQDNIHPYSYNGDSDHPNYSPMSKNELNLRIEYSFKDTDGDDLSVFYYTGHSTWDNVSASNYGITLGGSDGFYKWADLASFIANHVNGEVVVIMDACFSGYFQKNGVEALSYSDQQRFSVVSACSTDEESSSYNVAWNIIYGKLQYGCFTYYLGEGIGFTDGRLYADFNGDYKITLGELYDYTKRKVEAKNYEMTVGLYTSNRNKVLFEYQPSIKLNKKRVFIKKGKTYKLKAKTKNTYGKIIWRSDDNKVVAVSKSGKIKGKKKGSTVIYASINGKIATCRVKVV